MSIRVQHVLALTVAIGSLAVMQRSDAQAPAAPTSAPAAGALSAQVGGTEEDILTALLTRQTEDAIEQRLLHLEKTQNADGSWGSDKSYKIGSTAFAMIAFMMKGYFPGEKPYGDVLNKGVDALLRESKTSNGYMGRVMYEHGLATLALSELWGHTSRDEEVRAALKEAVKIILGSQSEVGGWRYSPTPKAGADVSVTVMITVALASARQAGIMVPDESIDRAIQYVEMCFNEVDGGYAYQAGMGGSGAARTAAAVVSLMMCGRHDTEYVQRGVRYMQDKTFGLGGKEGHYGCYYGAIATYKHTVDDFKKWYPPVRDMILKQRVGGGGGGLDAYETSVQAIVLAMPYGFVPAYQR